MASFLSFITTLPTVQLQPTTHMQELHPVCPDLKTQETVPTTMTVDAKASEVKAFFLERDYPARIIDSAMARESIEWKPSAEKNSATKYRLKV